MTGDQPQAVDKLASGILSGEKHQTLMGVTGSGKTFTMAGVIERVQKPTLVISHNKTLAAQLHGEFKEFFPENAVEYFVGAARCYYRSFCIMYLRARLAVRLRKSDAFAEAGYGKAAERYPSQAR